MKIFNSKNWLVGTKKENSLKQYYSILHTFSQNQAQLQEFLVLSPKAGKHVLKIWNEYAYSHPSNDTKYETNKLETYISSWIFWFNHCEVLHSEYSSARPGKSFTEFLCPKYHQSCGLRFILFPMIPTSVLNHNKLQLIVRSSTLNKAIGFNPW